MDIQKFCALVLIGISFGIGYDISQSNVRALKQQYCTNRFIGTYNYVEIDGRNYCKQKNGDSFLVVEWMNEKNEQTSR